ncbi:MAG TPA: hypothetical protein VGM54_03205 [Chthoniobacter sp.]|jgi:hypothetical protein
MRIDRSHSLWFVFTVVATLTASLLYAANFRPDLLPFHVSLPAFFGEVPPIRRARGATPLGLIFGILTLAIFLFASALGIRKKRRTWPLGHVRHWLMAHIWLTILTIPLVLFHCGFHVGGLQARWLIVLYVAVMISGFFGLAVQQFIPRMMREQLSREMVFDEIPSLRVKLQLTVEEIRSSLRLHQRLIAADTRPGRAAVAEVTSVRVLEKFLDTDCLPYLAAKNGKRHSLGDAGRAAQIFHAVRVNVAPEWRSKVDEIERCCNERRWTDLQTSFQHWLHGWLLIHVPFSFALLVFALCHAWAALRFLIIPA